MGDFAVPASDQLVLPTFISSWSFLCNARNLGLAGPGTVAWGVANQAIYIPLFLPWPYPVARIFWGNGSSATGNSDIGIYSVNGTLLWSKGSTAHSGANAPQYSAVNMLLPAGKYYLGYSHSATTANQTYGVTTASAPACRANGVFQQSSALPLPATMTPAVSTGGSYPMIGITRTPSGF